MLLVFVFGLAQLSGCGVVNNNQLVKYDGPPAIDVDTSRLKDAVPKIEPFHPYGTRDYVLDGRHYRVLKSSKGYVKRGYASWYGSSFHGRQTSTQERFNLYDMTAASPELPLPSYVQVTNLHNGKKVIVRVNDRGPFYNNRIIDLSYAAAKKLDFVDKGVTPVKVTAIDPRTWRRKSAPVNNVSYAKAESSKRMLLAKAKPLDQKRVFLQVGAFAELNNAKRLSNKVNSIIGKPAHIEHKSDLYHVHIGPLAADSSQFNQLKSALEQHGFDQVTVIDG